VQSISTANRGINDESLAEDPIKRRRCEGWKRWYKK